MTTSQDLASSLAPLLPGWQVGPPHFDHDEHGYLSRQDGALSPAGYRVVALIYFHPSCAF